MSREEYDRMKKEGKKVAEITITPEQMESAMQGRSLSEQEIIRLISGQRARSDVAEPKEEAETEIDITEMSIEQILFIPELALSEEETEEILIGAEHGLTDAQIKSYLLLGDAASMRKKRKLIESLEKRKEGMKHE